MNDHDHDHEHEPDRDREAHLALSRVVDRVADPADWNLLEHLGRADAGLWQRLADLLRDDDALRSAVESELAAVEAVPAPVFARRRWWTGLPSWSGWAAAALLALSWALSPSVPAVDDESPRWVGGQDARDPMVRRPVGLDTSRRVADALAGVPPGPAITSAPGAPVAAAGLDAGTAITPSAPGAELLGELPAELLSTRPLADGSGVELFTLRRVLQREVVAGVYALGADELGNPRPVAVSPESLLASDLY